jgi:hypothetical protein
VPDPSNGNPFGGNGIRILTPSNEFYSSQSHDSSDAILPSVVNSLNHPYQNPPSYSDSDSHLLSRSGPHFDSKDGFVISPPAPPEHVLNHQGEVLFGAPPDYIDPNSSVQANGVTLEFDNDEEDGFSFFVRVSDIVLDSQETQIDNSETQDWTEIVYDVSSSESASVETDLPTDAVTSTLRRSGRSSVIARRHFYFETPGSTFDLNAIPVHSLGEMNSSCDHCGALYFECEKNQQGLYFKCCRNGKVPDPSIPQPPVLIRNLIKHDSSFVCNIIYSE